MKVITGIVGILFLLLFFQTNKASLAPDKFNDNVVLSERVWLVEFYSDRCGSCKEFVPEWTRLEKQLVSIATGKINIDEAEGMKLAQTFGVLDEGLPAILLFFSNEKKPISLLEGDSALSHARIISKIKDNLTDLKKAEDGFYVKAKLS